MASIPKFANNFTTTLTQNASLSSDKLYLDVVDGLPDISGGNFFRLTIKRESDGAREIVKVNAVDTISRYVSVERGDENTTPLAFVVGDEVQLRLTAEPLNDIFADVDRLTTAEQNLLQAEIVATESADSAATSAANALVSENNAATSEANALASEQATAISESNASNSATASDNARIAAQLAQAATESVYDQFDDRYLGEKSSAPSTDNDGGPLITGAMYFNSTDSNTYIWTGSMWGGISNFATSEAAALSAAEALASEQAAALSETNAATSETNALASELAAASSEANTLISEQSAALSEVNAANSASSAATSASNANTDRILAQDAATTAQTAESNAVAVVTGGTASLTPEAGKIPIADASGKIDADWLAYTIPALNAQYPGLNAVDVCFYDTTKDSDGGAWTKRTGSLSYGKEARPSGRYLGQFADTVTAAAAGAVVGDWYYNTTNKKFYQLTNVTTPAATEIFRAGSAEFPSQVVIVAENARVIIFDASGSELTMWMVFVGNSTVGDNYSSGGALTTYLNAKVSSVSAHSGIIAVTKRDANMASCLDMINFPRNNATSRSSYYAARTLSDLALRYTQQRFVWVGNAATKLVNSLANDVAVTILPNTPTDSLTGLKGISTLVATDGGWSLITDSGVVYDGQVGSIIKSVSFGPDNEFYTVTDTGIVSVWANVADIIADGIPADSTVSNVLGTPTVITGVA